MVAIHKKIGRREERREQKALKAAKITDAIKQELLERLRQGTYGEIYNFPQQEYQQVLDGEEMQDEDSEDEERVSEYVEAYDDELISEDDMEDCMCFVKYRLAEESEIVLDDDDEDDWSESMDLPFRKSGGSAVPPPPPQRQCKSMNVKST